MGLRDGNPDSTLVFALIFAGLDGSLLAGLFNRRDRRQCARAPNDANSDSP